MKWLLMSLIVLTACGSAQLKPVDPEPIDWKKCPAPLSIPTPSGGWKNEGWIWKDDSLLVENNNHVCIDAVAKNSEENQRRVLQNKRAFEQKQVGLAERAQHWIEGIGGLGCAIFLLYVLSLF